MCPQNDSVPPGFSAGCAAETSEQLRQDSDGVSRSCLDCGRKILLRQAVAAICDGCGGPICPRCRSRQRRSGKRKCRTCGSPLPGFSLEAVGVNCGFCGRLFEVLEIGGTCAGPRCAGGNVICPACWQAGWSICQEDLITGLRLRHEAYDVRSGVSSSRLRQLAVELQQRLAFNIAELRVWTSASGVERAVRSVRALEPGGVKPWAVAAVERMVPANVRLPEIAVANLIELLPNDVACAFELVLDAGTVVLALAIVIDARRVLICGGEDRPYTVEEAQRAMHAVSQRWPAVKYVGLFSATGWEPDCWQRPPLFSGGYVMLLASGTATQFQIGGNIFGLPDASWICARRVFDLETTSEKMARIKAYLDANRANAAMPLGLGARSVMTELGLADTVLVDQAFDEICLRDRAFCVRVADDGERVLRC